VGVCMRETVGGVFGHSVLFDLVVLGVSRNVCFHLGFLPGRSQSLEERLLGHPCLPTWSGFLAR